VFPLFDIPNAKPKKTATGIRYANSPNKPNKTLLIALAAAPCISPTTHKNAKIATAKITMSITSFLIATSTLFLVFLFCDFLAPELEDFFLVVELLVLDLDVLVRLRDALLPDVCAIAIPPTEHIFSILYHHFCLLSRKSFRIYNPALNGTSRLRR
jgi:hypothetical protein